MPSAEYMLALKLKAMRTTDAVKGAKETDDIFQLMRVIGIDMADAAMQVLARYFPTSALLVDGRACPGHPRRDIAAGPAVTPQRRGVDGRHEAGHDDGAKRGGTEYRCAPYVGQGVPPRTGLEYLTWASPPEFKSRNIMTDEAPLRRAAQAPVEPAR